MLDTVGFLSETNKARSTFKSGKSNHHFENETTYSETTLQNITVCFYLPVVKNK